MLENVENWVAIPVFNHSSKLKAVVAESLAVCPNAVDDDGSTERISGNSFRKKIFKGAEC
ncbi:MAG: hypothetical protein WAX69_25805 [Victivallales bacterium]